MPSLDARRIARAAAELIVILVVATLAAAALDRVTSPPGLSVIYLLAVLLVAVRHGWAGALVIALAGTLALNFFFIAPVHRLTISDSENVAALVTYLLVAVVVGRLAARERDRAAEAHERARSAAAREGEAEMLAGVAAMLLAGERLEPRLDAVGARLAQALGLPTARIALTSAPEPHADERSVALPLTARRAWVHLPRDTPRDDPRHARVLNALAAVLDVALERERVARQVAETEAARRADVAKTAVLHTISHDLRSPLTAITTAAEALAHPDVAGEEHAELVAVVRGEAERLSRLVADLLDLSRIEAQAVAPRMDWCDMRDVVATAAAHAGDAPVTIELPAELPLVRADAAQLERVFANLLDNAVRVSPPGRPVRVTGGSGGGRVTVRVIDEGPGIPQSQRAQVFEPFNSGRGRTGGAGLGLAICRGFVEANGGRISLQSGPDGGAAFAVSLPLVPQPAAAPR